MFCCPLEEHLKLCQCDIAVVIERCTTALRDDYMDIEVLMCLCDWNTYCTLNLLRTPKTLIPYISNGWCTEEIC